MFAEKVCEQVVGFSAMAENEMFEVNGGYQADAAAGTMGGSKKDSVNQEIYQWAMEYRDEGFRDLEQAIATRDVGLAGQGLGKIIGGQETMNKYGPKN